MGTGALVGSVAVQAGPPVDAGLGVALVDVMLAVDAGETRETQAGEGIDPVHAGATIEAGTRETQEARGGVNTLDVETGLTEASW